MTNAIDARAIALSLLDDILERDAYCHTALKRTLTKYQDLKKQDRAFITRLVEGTIERKITIDMMIDSYSKTKVRKMKPAIRNILRMSVYQLKYMTQIPESAICNEAVKLTKKKGYQGLSGFVNGILRAMVRTPEKIVFPDKKKEPIRYLSFYYSIPEWIVERFCSEFQLDVVEKMLKAYVSVGKTSIRCNTNLISQKELVTLLADEGVTVEKGEYLEESFYISNYNYLGDLQSFQQGYFQVQDPASMLVGKIADVKAGQLVVDVCAAPGGKSLHLACCLNNVSNCTKGFKAMSHERILQLAKEKSYEQLKSVVISRDLTEKKVALIEENRSRLRQDNLVSQVQDALVLDEELIEKADVVIADLPCSGLGVIGKKPDIKYKIKEESLHQLALLQRQILDTIHQYVKPGGSLMYSTCTINPAENVENMNYIQDNYGFELEDLDPFIPEVLQCETTKKGYLQLLPGVHESDGFFIARFKRKAK